MGMLVQNNWLKFKEEGRNWVASLCLCDSGCTRALWVQCTRSEMFVPAPDHTPPPPEIFHLRSRIQGQKIPGSWIRIRIKEFK